MPAALDISDRSAHCYSCRSECGLVRRFFYAAASDEPAAHDSLCTTDHALSRALLRETTHIALFRRVAVRHALKLLVAICFLVALMDPSALGALLLLGSLLSVLALGGPAGTRVRALRRARSSCVYLCAVLTTAWVTLQYAVCIAWLRRCVLPDDSHAERSFLRFVGTPIVQVRALLCWTGAFLPVRGLFTLDCAMVACVVNDLAIMAVM